MHNFLPAGAVHLSTEMLEQHGLYELLRASGIRTGLGHPANVGQECL